MKKIYLFLIVLIFSAVGFNGCKDAFEDESVSSTSTTASEKRSVVEDDSDYIFDTDNATTIVCNTDAIEVSGSGVAVSGTVATINQAGTYIIQGALTNGQIIVDGPETELVKLVLNGVDINCSSSAPFYIKNCLRAIVMIADGTQNTLTDGTSKDDEDITSVFFSKCDLSFIAGEQATGVLTVNGNFGDAIKSKDGLIIKSGIINTNSPDDGIVGKDYLLVYDGTITVEATGDGLKGSDDGNGYIIINGGTLNITSTGSDAIQAESDVNISGGTLNLTTTGNIYATSKAFAPGNQTTSQTKTNSCKGIKAGLNISISGGTFNLATTDDAVHAGYTTTITGGTITASAGDDGIHSDYLLDIQGGNINITKSYEGLEASRIAISDGTVYIVSSDDGMNAAGSTYTDYDLTISGGLIHVYACGDGLDSNGNMTIAGGVTVVSQSGGGNSALDHGDSNAKFVISGGVICAMGASDMCTECIPSSSSQPCVYFTGSSLTSFAINDASGNNIMYCKANASFGFALFSAPQLTTGSNTVYSGGTASGSQYFENSNFYMPATYTDGTTIATYTQGSGTTVASGSVSGGGGRLNF